MAKNDLQGTLDLLVLKTLAQMDAMHGYGTATMPDRTMRNKSGLSMRM